MRARQLQLVLQAMGLPSAEAVITYSTVMVSCVAPGDAEATIAIQSGRRWEPDNNRLVVTAALVKDIRDGRTDLEAAEAQLDGVVSSRYPYPRWLGFAAPALLSMAVTIMFGGRPVDALTTLDIGLAIQSALARIELSNFFQVAFGVSATALLVVLLVKLGLPIHGGLALTGSLQRFLPGPAMVSGMHDFIDGALSSGTVRLAVDAIGDTWPGRA